MLTVHPSIMLGSYAWDEDLAPRDEFDLRLEALHTMIRDQGWRAAAVYGDAREHGWLAWLTNYIPRMRWALALFRPDGDPLLLVSMSSRDLPAMRRLTWIEDVKSAWEWKWFDQWLDGLEPGAIGAVGFDLMPPVVLDPLTHSLGDRFVLSEDCHALADARDVHRPRERAVMREAGKVCSAAAAAVSDAFRSGADVESAALNGERLARQMAAQDVRTLVSRDGGRTLEPYGARFTDRRRPLLAYLAVKYQGYWSEAFISSQSDAEREARERLSSVLAVFRPGAHVSRLASIASENLNGRVPHPVLEGAIGRRIGLSPNEGELLREGGDRLIKQNVVYALRIGLLAPQAGGAIVSAIVVARDDGFEFLTGSPNA